MSFPSGWLLVPVTGQYVQRDGTPAPGSVDFLTTQITLGDGTVITPETLSFPLDATGSFSGFLPATDDPSFAPQGWAYTVFENVPNGRAPFMIQAPHLSSGINMATVGPVVPPPQLAPYVNANTLAGTGSGQGAEIVGYLDGSNPTTVAAALAACAKSSTLATVATSGQYADLMGLPTLGTAAAHAATDFATAAQGTEADNATPAADLASTAAGKGAALVGRIAKGTAAVATTVDAVLNRSVWIEDYLASGFNPTTDDASSALGAAVNALPSGGGTVFFSRGYKFNYVLTKSNVTFAGVSGLPYSQSVDIQNTAYTPSSWCLQIGDGTTVVQGFSALNIGFQGGSGAAQYGVRIYGASNISFENFTCRDFSVSNVQIDSSATQPTYFVFFNGYAIAGSANSGSAAFTATYGSTYVTGIYLENGSIGSQSGGGYALTLNGVTVGMSNTYVQTWNNQGVNLTNLACIRGTAVTVDSNLSTDVLLEVDVASTNTTRFISDYIRGDILINGYVKFSDAVTKQFRGNFHVNYRGTLHYPMTIGRMSFSDPGVGIGNEDGSISDTAIPGIYYAGITLYVDASAVSGANVKLMGGSGAVVDIGSGGVLNYLRLNGSSSSVQIFCDSVGRLNCVGVMYPSQGLINPQGPTTGRPTSPTSGQQFFDTTLLLPIWWTGSAWVNAAGTPV